VLDSERGVCGVLSGLRAVGEAEGAERAAGEKQAGVPFGARADAGDPLRLTRPILRHRAGEPVQAGEHRLVPDAKEAR
jgi:hypothetical protein